MKKFLVFLIASALLLSNAIQVQALPEVKELQTTLSSSAEQIKVGETITLTAETPKHGTNYSVEWIGAQPLETMLNGLLCCYVSKAQFTPTEAGTYTIYYSIKMNTGNGEYKFSSSASKTIEVITDQQTVSVAGLEVRNVEAYPFTNDAGLIEGYSVLGDLYILWSDNSATLKNRVSYFFLPNETSRVVNITVEINSQLYTYPVTITINN